MKTFETTKSYESNMNDVIAGVKIQIQYWHGHQIEIDERSEKGTTNEPISIFFENAYTTR